MIRKFDIVLQSILLAVIIIIIPFGGIFLSLAGLFILGCWQLLSASVNTLLVNKNAFLNHHFKKYWLHTGIVLITFFILWFLEENLTTYNTVWTWLIAIPLLLSAFIAAEYIWLYSKIITEKNFRKELGTVIRQHHF
jgi:hypothetical protein